MSEFEMDGEGLVLPESPDSQKENCSILSNGDTLSSSDIQPLDAGVCEVINTGVEYKKSTALCSLCSLSPSKEEPSDITWTDSAPSSYSMDSKISKFGCQTPSSQIHSKNSEDECASLILACLFCQFYDFLLMLPHTCVHLWTRMCGCRCRKYNSDIRSNSDDCNCKCDFDCGMFDSCQETSDCLELALEISEVCYR
ncbi:myoD family inhibitor domain-containing protein 2 [Hypanus sabinus]|uniref:myoD family inhibitor domain-containing protein 2 n=1 Tax=Hypanus sabinus TaxID=79690 RepID=UPI0028C4ED5E|nr:myoD family inhibitor domain-containing protein 2 [Hypanus sabinus]